MKHLILDANIVVDLLAERMPHFPTVSQALAEAEGQGYKLWVVAASLPTMTGLMEKEVEHGRENAPSADESPTRSPGVIARRRLKRFFDNVDVLSSHGFEISDILDGPCPEAMFILRASEILGEGVTVLSQDQAFINLDARVLSPEMFLKALSTPSESKKIPFIDLKAQQTRLLPQLEQSVFNVLRHGQYILGPEVAALEGRLAEYVGAGHAISCASGTDAILMALMAYGVGPGDAVFTTPFTFIATAEVISLVGATPVFVDIDPRTFNIDPEALRKAIVAVKEKDPGIYVLPDVSSLPAGGLNPKGILAVDLFGLPAEYREINSLAREHHLFVIEDAAQSFGAGYHGKKACTLADVGCTSFFPAKPLGCYGDGGAVFTDDDELAERMTSIRVHGKGTGKYDNVRIGLNARMDTLQAAILLAKLAIFPEELKARDRVAGRYTELLGGGGGSLHTPFVPEGLISAWAQYSVLSDKKQMILDALKAEGIPTAVYYPTPLHQQTAFAGLGYKAGDFPVSDDASKQIFSLPMHPYLDEGPIERIAGVITNVINPKA